MTDHMSSASSRPTQLPPTTQSQMTTGAVTTRCKVPFPPAPLPSSSFANDPEQRGDDEQEEWGRQRRHRAPRPCMDVRRADGRRDRGIIDAAVVEPCGPKFGGGEGGGMKRQSIGKGEVASSFSDESCRGRGCVVKRCGQRPWGEGGRGTTMTTMAGGVVASSLALARLRSQLSSILLSRTKKEKERGALEGPNNQHIIGKKQINRPHHFYFSFFNPPNLIFP